MNNLKIIMCLDQYGGFAKNGQIPWIDDTGKNKYPEDFKHFKKITNGHVCVMGRNTYEDMVRLFGLQNKEIGKNILPGRKSYVLSRSGNFEMKGVEHAMDLLDVYNKEKDKQIFILGGERVVTMALPSTSEVYLTVLKQSYGCDKKFPLKYLQENFYIDSGEEKDELYFVNYKRKK